MKLVCIGDSLTYGYGVPSKACWVELLKMHFNMKIINKGVNGDTTSGILSRSYIDVVGEKPDYVIIMAGTNDILMNHPLKSVKRNIELLIGEAKENNIISIIALQPPIAAALAKVYWDGEVNYEKANTDLLNYVKWAKAYSKDNNIDFVDFYNSFISEDDVNKLYSDGIHPNVDGHKLMFNIAAELLCKIKAMALN